MWQAPCHLAWVSRAPLYPPMSGHQWPPVQEGPWRLSTPLLSRGVVLGPRMRRKPAQSHTARWWQGQGWSSGPWCMDSTVTTGACAPLTVTGFTVGLQVCPSASESLTWMSDPMGRAERPEERRLSPCSTWAGGWWPPVGGGPHLTAGSWLLLDPCAGFEAAREACCAGQ